MAFPLTRQKKLIYRIFYPSMFAELYGPVIVTSSGPGTYLLKQRIRESRPSLDRRGGITKRLIFGRYVKER